MKQQSHLSLIFLISFSFCLNTLVFFSSVYAYPENTTEKQQTGLKRIYGKVTETFAVTGYTYVEVDDGNNKVWAAGPVTALKVGDMIAFTTDMPMENYYSKTMKREFPVIYFVERFITDKVEPSSDPEKAPSPHDSIKQGQAIQSVPGIEKVKDGFSIAEIYKQKQALKGKTVRVRGQVTKATNQVMGKNWLHIRDSSTLEDLTVTTNDIAAVDDIVIVEGTLELDKDFSYGYRYPVIVEDAAIIKE